MRRREPAAELGRAEQLPTIAGAAIAYGHSIVAQSPIDVNMGKQLKSSDRHGREARADRDGPDDRRLGYGIEYSLLVMERIRLTALGGDGMLAAPLIVAPGQECVKVKECKAAEKDFPAWGDLRKARRHVGTHHRPRPALRRRGCPGHEPSRAPCGE